MENCTCIKLKAVDQRLTIVQQPVLASGDVGTVRVEFVLDSYWDGYKTSGTFYTGTKPDEVYEQLLENGSCVIPWEVLQNEGILFIGLRGVSGDGLVKTAAPVRYRIEKGSPCGTDTAKGPTEDVYQQLLLIAANAEETARSVRDDADAGKFSVSHKWTGTTLEITSSSGASSANLQGVRGVHVGPDEPTDGSEFWVDTDDEAPASPSIPYSEFVDAVLFPSAIYKSDQITISDNSMIHPKFLGFVEGQTYTVVWEGVTYTCVAEERNVFGYPAVAIGNPVFTGGENNNMPFGVADIPAKGVGGFMAMADGTYKVTISGKKEIVHQIDAKYSNEFRVNLFQNGNNYYCLHTIEELIAAVESGKRLYVLLDDRYDNGSACVRRYNLVSAEYNKTLLAAGEYQCAMFLFSGIGRDSSSPLLSPVINLSLFTLTDVSTPGELIGVLMERKIMDLND